MSTRSPSGSAKSGIRGRLPVEIRTASASSSSTPSAVSTTTSCGPFMPGRARDEAHALVVEQAATWPWSRPVIAPMRVRSRSRSISGSLRTRPMPSMRRPNDMAPPVAIIAFDGMQSHRWAAPPRTSRSTSVTSAPEPGGVGGGGVAGGPAADDDEAGGHGVEATEPRSGARGLVGSSSSGSTRLVRDRGSRSPATSRSVASMPRRTRPARARYDGGIAERRTRRRRDRRPAPGRSSRWSRIAHERRARARRRRTRRRACRRGSSRRRRGRCRRRAAPRPPSSVDGRNALRHRWRRGR